MAFSRRSFLRSAAWTVGGGLVGGTLGLGGVLWHAQPERARLDPLAQDGFTRPERLPPGHEQRVVVVGGGVAGISAATSLAERGFRVTLVERSPELGGKLTGWPLNLDDKLGGRVPMEHGFHGFFRQYYTLDSLLTAAAVAERDLVPASSYPVLFPDRVEVFGTTSRLFPLNLLQVIRDSPSLKWSQFKDDGPGLTELMLYRGEPTFARFDGISFADFMREKNIHGGMVQTVLRPFGKTTLNAIERLSTAEAIRFFHFYFMGNPEGLGFRCLARDAMTAVVGPLERRMRALGVDVRTGCEALELVRDGARVCGVAVDGGRMPPAGSQDTPSPTRARGTFAAADVPQSGYLLVDTSDGPVYVRRNTGTADPFAALDGRCTHMGCAVAYSDEDGGGFRCPCHGGRFNEVGTPIAGPPPRALDTVPIRDVGQGRFLLVEVTSPTREVLPCDWAVVACEVRGLRRLVAKSDLGASPSVAKFRADVAALGEADPYAVARFWLDRPVRENRPPFYTVSGFPYTDSIAIYSTFQEPFVSWARARGGSVVETHAYAIPPDKVGSIAKYRDALLAELRQALPELRDATVLHEEVTAQDNFTRFAPGDHARRPSTVTPLANLLLAGDHVRLPVPAFLMEAAALSGRLAANLIFSVEGVREFPIDTVAARGPLV